MSTLAELATRSVAAARDADADTRHQAARQVLDVLGCVASGAGHPVATTWLPLVPEVDDDPRRGGVVLPGVPGVRALDDAVEVGATLAHLDELDPLHGPGAFAAGAVVVPTAVAVSLAHGCPGELLARAVVAGHEAGIDASLRFGGPALYGRGLWPTAVFGPLAAAAATSVLLGLDEDATTRALALAAAGIGGFLSADVLGHGHYLLAGTAARAGLRAARGAQAGLAVSTTLLDGPAAALFGHPPAPASPPGAPHVTGVGTKTWPCSRPLQSALAALDEIGTAPRAGDTVVVALPAAARHFVTADPAPADATTAAASAVVAVRGHAVGRAADPRWYRDVAAGVERGPEIAVELAAADDLDAAFPARWGAHVRVERDGGTVGAASCLVPPGDPERPLDDAALLARASRLAGQDLAGWLDLDAGPFVGAGRRGP
ncbi:2-methylcitrate dehydratase PrpD [Actinomycetospora succinea]|uniref:2-methylcitrate dehydratase PrpD n=1 Tax=Actinomycetospora succinea TaxID=663603 RepID=A0A4V3DAJ0_9PSEU|nr:MmgE/PrpD family protein [Actinomycetospora succinea]TDQ62363.1 2-methylcitrate dehydratase PrpD [Actinomycetospora succinea]